MSEWNAADDATLHRMKKRGCSWDEITNALGRSFDSCRNRLRRNGSDKPEPEENAKRIRELEKMVEQQAEALEQARAPRQAFKIAKSQVHSDDFCRVIIPDTHGSQVDPDAMAAFLNDLEAIRPREIVMLGDHLDCGGFLAQHHTMGYVAQTEYTFEQDVAACNQFLDQIAELSPNAEVHYIEGNHERRLEAFCVTQSLRNSVDAAYLRRMFSTKSVLSLETRGITLYEQGKKYHGLSLPASIRLGKCHFTHGSRTGKYAASMTLADFGANVVYGHTHRPDFHAKPNVASGTLAAWNPGCLCILQPYWHHDSAFGHSHGYGLQLVGGDGDFLHVNVPIINGKSYLGALTSNLTASVRRKAKSTRHTSLST